MILSETGISIYLIISKLAYISEQMPNGRTDPMLHCQLGQSSPCWPPKALNLSPHLGRFLGYLVPDNPALPPDSPANMSQMEDFSHFPPLQQRSSKETLALCVFRCQSLNTGSFFSPLYGRLYSNLILNHTDTPCYGPFPGLLAWLC